MNTIQKAVNALTALKALTALTALTALAMCTLSLPSVALAQTKDLSVPPNLEKIEEIPDTGVKIAKPEAKVEKIVERKVNGKVTEVQVTSGNSQYVVKPNSETAKSNDGTVGATTNRAAMWKIFEFGGPKELPPANAPDALAPAPVPPNVTEIKATAASSAASTPALKK